MARAAEAGVPYKATVPNMKRGRKRAGSDTPDVSELPREDLASLIQSLTDEMHEASGDLRFEYAARLRDEIADLKRELRGMEEALK
jgi:excinuclease ABC subunit B